MSPDNLRAARRLYDAFDSQDARALLAVLAPGFRGVVSAGMPGGVGGSYDGPEAMLRDCWARVFALPLSTHPPEGVTGTLDAYPCGDVAVFESYPQGAAHAGTQ